MSLADELAALYRRDLTRLAQQLSGFTEEALLWRHVPGIANPAGNLMLHLEGNLRDFIGRELGGHPYQRTRDREFAAAGISAAKLATRLAELVELIPAAIERLSEDRLCARYPGEPLGVSMSTRQFLIHLNGHLNYHLGQIDYLRRILTAGAAITYAHL